VLSGIRPVLILSLSSPVLPRFQVGILEK